MCECFATVQDPDVRCHSGLLLVIGDVDLQRYDTVTRTEARSQGNNKCMTADRSGNFIID